MTGQGLARRVDAIDVVQDVLLEVSQRLNDYICRCTMPFYVRLSQLAGDRLIDMHGRRRVVQRSSVEWKQAIATFGDDDSSSVEMNSLREDAELTPAAGTVRREMEQRFLAALNSLADDDREFILMYHFEDLRSAEVVQSMGLTAPTAGMRYLRTIRRLRAVIAKRNNRVTWA